MFSTIAQLSNRNKFNFYSGDKLRWDFVSINLGFYIRIFQCMDARTHFFLFVVFFFCILLYFANFLPPLVYFNSVKCIELLRRREKFTIFVYSLLPSSVCMADIQCITISTSIFDNTQTNDRTNDRTKTNRKQTIERTNLKTITIRALFVTK